MNDMKQNSLFELDLIDIHKPDFKYYLSILDLKGLLIYIYQLTEYELCLEALNNGFSVISFSHGRNKVIEDIINQISKNK